MIRNILMVIGGIASILVLVAGFWFGRKVQFAEQWPLFEALRTTSSIIFAVVGAWLAIIYPERLKLSFRSDGTKPISQSGSIGQLLSPAVHSTAILSIVLMVGVTAPLLKQLEMLQPYVTWLRGISYALLVFLTLWQLWTLILTLIPADKIKSHTDMEDRSRDTVRNYKCLGNMPKDHL